MRRITQSLWIACLAATLLQLSCGALKAGAAAPGERLVWDARRQKVEADLQSADLKGTLAKISRAAGWNIYLQPGTERKISAKFQNLKPGQALRQLLGDLNYALVPQTNGPAKLLVYSTSLQAATQLIEQSSGRVPGQPIPNELLVKLKPESERKIDELASKVGAEVVGSIDSLKTHRLEFPDAEAAEKGRAQLSRLNDVSLDSNYAIPSPGEEHESSGTAAARLNLKPKTTPGGPLIIGMVDTPIPSTEKQLNDFLLPAIHVAGQPLSPEGLTHGASMAQTILNGVALANQDPEGSRVRILPVDVYGPNEETTTFDMAAGIHAAIRGGATVINMSMGGDGDSLFLRQMIEEAHRHGVLFFGAAGNEPTTEPVFPAAYPPVIAVTAGEPNGTLSPYANRGDFVDVIAPGSNFIRYGGQTYVVTGTSGSTALVSGFGAAYLSAGRTPAEVEKLIRSGEKPR